VSGASQVTALQGVTTVLRESFIYGYGLADPTLPGEKIVVRAENEEKRAAKTFRNLLGKAEDDQGEPRGAAGHRTVASRDRVEPLGGPSRLHVSGIGKNGPNRGR
jgi:hypothetical protein